MAIMAMSKGSLEKVKMIMTSCEHAKPDEKSLLDAFKFIFNAFSIAY